MTAYNSAVTYSQEEAKGGEGNGQCQQLDLQLQA